MDQFADKIRRRGLAVVGIFLLLVAVEGLVRNEITMVNEAPQMGTVFGVPETPHSLSSVLIKLNNMPFLLSGLIGGAFIVLDVRKYMKEQSAIQ